MTAKTGASPRARTLSIHDLDWNELKRIAEAELGPAGRHCDGLRILVNRHRKATPEPRETAA